MSEQTAITERLEAYRQRYALEIIANRLGWDVETFKRLLFVKYLKCYRGVQG